MEKVIRDGKVAILLSPGFGAGWYSWNTNYPELLFHPKIVELVESGLQNQIDEEYCKEVLGLDNVCTLGASELKIEWINKGERFIIDEYDGSESLLLVDKISIKA
jgi:hypothetical protein